MRGADKVVENIDLRAQIDKRGGTLGFDSNAPNEAATALVHVVWTLEHALNVATWNTGREIVPCEKYPNNQLYPPDKTLIKPDFRNGSNRLLSVLQLSCGTAPRTVIVLILAPASTPMRNTSTHRPNGGD